MGFRQLIVLSGDHITIQNAGKFEILATSLGGTKRTKLQSSAYCFPSQLILKLDNKKLPPPKVVEIVF